jgi:hypothetical protein
MLNRFLSCFVGFLLALALTSCEKQNKTVIAASPVQHEVSQQGDQLNPSAPAKPEVVSQAAIPANQPSVQTTEDQPSVPQHNQQANEEWQNALSQIDEYLAKPGLDDQTRKSLEKIREELKKNLR